jgi:CheY-like chemotaxis protein
MRRTILLADDSPTIQRLVKQTFEDGNFDVVSVSNGDAAIKKFDEIRPDVVLADIYMPGKNGYEVCAYVRGHATLKGTPVVLLVGAFDAFDEARAKQTGANANITKPFEPGALVELVSSVLSTPARDPDPPAPVTESKPTPDGGESDLLGLESIFKEDSPGSQTGGTGLSDDEIDRIVDRVIQRLSTQAIESVAWDIVPDIAEKIVREELKRHQ